jgi:hypothetical protein
MRLRGEAKRIPLLVAGVWAACLVGCSPATSPPAAPETASSAVATAAAAPGSGERAAAAPTGERAAAAPDPSDSAQRVGYAWLTAYDPASAVAARFARPANSVSTAEEAGSFGDWLRHLPLKKGNPPVLLFDGRPKANQAGHAAVVDIDTGTRDLQQCADSIIRLRAEYLFAAGRAAEIHFNFTSGDRVDFKRWLAGETPVARGNAVTWTRGQPREASHAVLRKYLDVIFEYAGTQSLAKELRPVPSVRDMRIGDVFITPGSPGHAVIVVDMAAQAGGGRKFFMLAQGYMPAQDMHVLWNPSAADTAWYDVDFGDTLRTPEWTFSRTDLRRFY